MVEQIEEQNTPFDWGAAKEEWHRVACELWENAPKIYKDFYEEHPQVTAMLPEEVAAFRKATNNIMVFAEGNQPISAIPKPCQTFEHAFWNHPLIMEEIRKAGFERPSPIQSQIWPVALSGHDSIAIAQTGTGKTLGFLLPAFIHLENQVTHRDNPNKPLVLVLCPTRELALQTEKEFNKYSYKGYKAVCVYGGGNRREQIQAIENGCQFIIATPGRLSDICSQNIIDLTLVSYVILDEADRMLDLGFEPQIIRILSQMRPDRQTILTSATWPLDIQRLSAKYLNNPVKIQVGTLELNASHTIAQHIFFLGEHEKFSSVFNVIRENINEKIIIFCTKKIICSHLASEMLSAEIVCTSIHGDMSQDARIESLNEFKTNLCNILVATDVASRGIDVPDVTMVINYDMPKTVEDYVHRIGRTGRAGKNGKAISFFTKPDSRLAGGIIKLLEEAGQEVPDLLRTYRENQIRFDQQKQQNQYGGRGGFSRGGGGSRHSGDFERNSSGGGYHRDSGYGRENHYNGGFTGDRNGGPRGDREGGFRRGLNNHHNQDGDGRYNSNFNSGGRGRGRRFDGDGQSDFGSQNYGSSNFRSSSSNPAPDDSW